LGQECVSFIRHQPTTPGVSRIHPAKKPALPHSQPVAPGVIRPHQVLHLLQSLIPCLTKFVFGSAKMLCE